MKIILVAGARPNFMKIAPLINAIDAYNSAKDEKSPFFEYMLVHTGQHYDDNMSKTFFDDLGMPKPHIDLGVGSGTHATQTGKIMIRFEEVCLQHGPDLVMVVGDVNSTIACTLVAAKLGIPAAHVEAGLRSYDRTMPEEINRVLTDQLSDYLFTTCEDAAHNLRKEGIPEERIFFVGNVMIDTLLSHIEKAKSSDILERLGLREEGGGVVRYASLTLHRPSNVDDPEILKGILGVLKDLAEEIPIVFPVHPRTLQRIKSSRLEKMITISDTENMREMGKAGSGVLAIPPLGYLDFLCLMSNSTIVLTDSGGIQEETTILGIPCLTLRKNTERPITVKEGTNTVVGNDPEMIREHVLRILKRRDQKSNMPKYWDGKASERIIKVLVEKFGRPL
jgi:UDP-N-acetylglucosamine 2-epimerase (non-hydrolysing)